MAKKGSNPDPPIGATRPPAPPPPSRGMVLATDKTHANDRIYTIKQSVINWERALESGTPAMGKHTPAKMLDAIKFLLRKLENKG